ncbi:alpha/beta hydrolase [Kitasatospora sp. NPDC059811]|uniref:alpha/beta hydrolase n=1 Tax=Streptomycetaceae TaxID=2062 RepID=UPI0007AF7ADA
MTTPKALRRVAAAGLALTACLATAPAATAAAAERDDGPASAAAGLDRYHHQRLDWRSCVLGPDDEVGRVVAAAEREPLTVGTAPDDFRLDGSQVPALLFAGLASDLDPARAGLAEQLSVLAKAADGQPTRVSPGFAAFLREAFTSAGSATGSVQTAILCGDVAAPRDPERYWRDIERGRAAHPLFSPMTENITPCAFWDAPREEPTQVRRDTAALLVAASGDPRTPYRGSVALHGMLPSSRLVTLDGAFQHTGFGVYGNACVDDSVNTYLATGRLPGKDRTCAK